MCMYVLTRSQCHKMLVFLMVMVKTKHTVESQKPLSFGPSTRGTFLTNGKLPQFGTSSGGKHNHGCRRLGNRIWGVTAHGYLVSFWGEENGVRSTYKYIKSH